jgi:WD40 repeat protein
MNDSGHIHVISVRTGAISSTIDGFGMRSASPVTSLILCRTLNCIVGTNGTGYVRFFSLENLSVTKRFRAHENSVITASISEQNNILVTGGADGDVRLWSLDNEDFAIGELAAGRSWDMEDKQSWLGGSGLGEDSLDFAVPRVAVAEIVPEILTHEEEEIAETAEAEHSPIQQPINVRHLQELFDDLEETLYGRRARLSPRIVQKQKRLTREIRNLELGQLIPKTELESASEGWQSLKNRGSVNLRTVLPKLTGPIAERELEIPPAANPRMSFLKAARSKTLFDDGPR